MYSEKQRYLFTIIGYVLYNYIDYKNTSKIKLKGGVVRKRVHL